ncbi:MAG: thiamine phosphate synthase [Sulfuricurvum sp.]|uniref:thiamine phosphate synthase n=1 Tax=Sulfuricurvum sp. TaxID=2025608 RepID=UPI00260AE986|nr:thiamine phosphate synthase [Sulfuricurvum sp.]MDD2368208.1 thiamine phosphate synthase [Sulfuricurvum sp.]MDD2949723.1 thiamine phosphate synthase [Sulfuricurvum sp.]MDD5119388.1 thiamine phosphate synthase [Sulfuricurvum sp.]
MRLYALCDAETLRERGVDLLSFAGRAKTLGAEVLQYRNKFADIAIVKADLITLRKVWEGFLIINDHYELASFCDGVHIGQEDLYAIDSDPVRAINILKMAIGEDKLIGLSTHNAQEITIANSLDINYIGLGAYRATSTKSDAKVLGEKLDELSSLSNHPVAAIGGVKLDDTFKYVTYHVIGSGLL